jgi:hypothetical protein
MSGAIFIYSPDPYSAQPVMHAKVVRHKGSGPHSPTPIGIDMTTALLLTCRQVHVESAEVLYGKNIFRLYSTYSNASFAPLYTSLVRHIVFTTDSMVEKIFAANLETVEYWWQKHFWPDVVAKSTKVLTTFPYLESLTFPMKSRQHGLACDPALIPVFMAFPKQKTREQRVALGAAWLKEKCPFPDDNDRLRKCLQLEVVPTAAASRSYYASGGADIGSRWWDMSEFSEAFTKMRSD